MRAIVKFEAGPGAVRYVEHPDPRPGPHEIVGEIVEDQTPVLVSPLVTHTLPLSAFDEAVQHVEDRTAIKVLLDPTYAPCEWPPRPSARSGTD